MSERREQASENMSGALVLDKPSGPSSFTAMRTAQRALGQKTAGHGGTLDPLASGVLVVLLGEATKLSALVMDHSKSYEAEVRLGVATDTLDAAGVVTAEAPVPPDALRIDHIEAALVRFVGDVMQVPPRYSALKVEGRTNMSRARAGEEFEVAERPARCDRLELLEVLPAGFRIRIDCGKGYYVRSLARDLGEALGVPSHLAALRRTRVGDFDLTRAVAPAEAKPADVIAIPEVVPRLARVIVSVPEVAALRVGKTINAPANLTADQALALSEAGEPIALLVRADDPRRLKVTRGFNV